MRKILILNGHSGDESLSKHLAGIYKSGAESTGNEVKTINISELDFDPILHQGYKVIQDLEEDLKTFQKDLLWADHFVVVYPTWWGNMPAILKGFFDRVFIPRFAYQRLSKLKYIGLLKGRSARIITTCGAPWYAYFLAGNTHRNVRKNLLGLCGFSPIRVTLIYDAERIPEKRFKKIEDKIYKLGKLGK